MILLLTLLLILLALFVPFAIASSFAICIMQNKPPGVIRNRAAAPGNPALDLPLSLPLVFVPRVRNNLSRSFQWLLRWPSWTELLMSAQVTLLLLPPFPQLLNNVLEEILSWFSGKYGDPDGALPDPFRDFVRFVRFLPIVAKRMKTSVDLLLRWFSFVRDPRTHMVNLNHALVNYFQGLNFSLPQNFDVETLPVGDWVTKPKTQLMALCSRLAYERWHVARSIVENDWPDFDFVCAWHFDRISLIPNPKDNKHETSYVKTSAFLLSTRGGALILAFRGTEPLENVGWLTDFDVVPPSESETGWPYGKYHSGFRRALGLDHALRGDPSVSCGYLEQEGPLLVRKPPERQSPYEIISARVRDVLGGKGRLYVTGHSLGGALANLYVAAALSPSPGRGENADLGGTEVGLYTFGQPRVGNNQYARHVARALNRQQPTPGRLPRYARVVNTNDIVPRVPPPLDNFYQHSGQLIFLKPAPTNRNPNPNPNPTLNPNPIPNPATPVVFLQEQPIIFRNTAIIQGTRKALYALDDYVKCVHGSSLVTVVLAWFSVYTTLILAILFAPVLIVVDLVLWVLLLALGVFLLGLPVGLLDHSLGGYEAGFENSGNNDWNP